MYIECNRKTRTEMFLLKRFVPSQASYRCLQRYFFSLASRKCMHTNICSIIDIYHTWGIGLCCNKKSHNRIVSLIWKLKCLINLLPCPSILTPSLTWWGEKSIIAIAPTRKRIKLFGSEIFTVVTPVSHWVFCYGHLCLALFWIIEHGVLWNVLSHVCFFIH